MHHLFIVGMRNGVESKAGIEGSKLRRLDDICVKADLISATRAMSIPDFDGDLFELNMAWCKNNQGKLFIKRFREI